MNNQEWKPGDTVNGFIMTTDNQWVPFKKPPGKGRKVARVFGTVVMLSAAFVAGAAIVSQQSVIRTAVAASEPPEAEEALWEDQDLDKDGVPNGEDPLPSETQPPVCSQLAEERPISYKPIAPYSEKIVGLTKVLNHCPGLAQAFKEATAMTVANEVQERALRDAERYLELTSYSRQQLIALLTEEAEVKYPIEVATWAVDQLRVDWKEQAVAEARQYLKFLPRDRAALIAQLTTNSGYSQDEAVYAATVLGL